MYFIYYIIIFSVEVFYLYIIFVVVSMQDVAALESQPLLGFSLQTEKPESSLCFKLYHKNKLYYIFRASDSQIFKR